MQAFYFTYGSEGQPFRGGWTIVHAETWHQAEQIFLAVHPLKDGFIPCCTMYAEEDFKKTIMYQRGNNLGAGTQEIIEIKRVVFGKEEIYE